MWEDFLPKFVKPNLWNNNLKVLLFTLFVEFKLTADNFSFIRWTFASTLSWDALAFYLYKWKLVKKKNTSKKSTSLRRIICQSTLPSKRFEEEGRWLHQIGEWGVVHKKVLNTLTLTSFSKNLRFSKNLWITEKRVKIIMTFFVNKPLMKFFS